MDETFINYNLVEIALENINGTLFEKFANNFFSNIFGVEFIPLGGVKDGGADAFKDKGLWESSLRNAVFYQASVQKDYKQKIRATTKRLREVGRKPKRVIYLTSQAIPNIDELEETLTDELDCTIKIRDKRYIVSQINHSYGTRAAYKTYLEPALGYLAQVGASKLISPSDIETSSAIYVFLRQEIDRHKGKASLVNALTDGLILWALEGTDPDNGILMTEPQIIKKIQESVPSALRVIKGAIPNRLERLSKKPHDERPIRHYTKKQAYCLSYEFRERLIVDNAVDETLRIKVREIFIQRLTEFKTNSLTLKEVDSASELSIKIIQQTFEKQGLEFATFISQTDYQINNLTIADYFDESVDEFNFKPERVLIIKEAVLENLRAAFYNSEECERLFFSRLSSTYTLLFCLKSEPRIVEYFQRMASDFYLYVGSDLLVRALSERYLRPEDQITRNTLKIIKEAGGKLILADSVLDEVYSHIKSSDLEFSNFYRPIEPSITIDIARQSDRILIRAYFYAKLTPIEGLKAPSDWSQFVSQFCDPSAIRMAQGREQIRKYLVSTFGLRYEDKEELMKFTNESQVNELTEKLLDYKKQERLAKNDALLTLAVYGRRRARKETSEVSEYGYRTWWLTQESRIIYYTRDIEKRNGAKYIMRPEFLVNFFSLAPSVSEIRQSYASIFPTVLGIRLARRVSQEKLLEVLNLAKEAQELEDGRRNAKISELSDELKTTMLSSEIRHKEHTSKLEV